MPAPVQLGPTSAPASTARAARQQSLLQAKAPRNGALRGVSATGAIGCGGATGAELATGTLLTCTGACWVATGGATGTAMVFLPFPFSLPGMCSSITTWKLSAETEGADAHAPRIAVGKVPRPQLGVDIKRRVRKIDIWAWGLAMEAGKEEPCCAATTRLSAFQRRPPRP